MRCALPCLIAIACVLAFAVAPVVLSLPASGTVGSARAVGSSGAESGAPLQPLTTPVAHDLVVTAANVTTLAGMPVNFTASISGAAPVTTTWWWGDGSTTTATSGTAEHVYGNPGIYLVYAEGTDSTGGLHDNLDSLLRFAVLDSYTGDALGNQTQLQGDVVANSSSTTSAQALVAPGGWLQVSNWVTNLPTNPQWALQAPSYDVGSPAIPYVSMSSVLGSGLNLSAATVGWSNSTPQGSYTLNFTVTDVDAMQSGSVPTLNTFTFTVFIAAAAETPVTPTPTSPHNGTLEVYQLLEDSSQNMTLDPGLADDPTDGPILQNLYQTLIVYNGSHAGPAPSDFVPDLATCVPGSPQCVQLYGSSLVSGDNWTFVINPNATFYNGTTGDAWTVYPNDVAFSFARSCLFADPVGLEGYENFVLCQALLPDTANSSWDGGLHAPYNNTPGNILAAITVNDTRYCTAAMENGVLGDGCVTLDTSASGRAWPEFLEFVESTSGWAVIPCSWAASVGMGLPGWTDGDSCYPAPPGQAGNPNAVPLPTQWDPYELTYGSFGNVSTNSIPNSPLRTHAVGSGPYYLVSFDNDTGYSLKVNPDWGGTTCQGGSVDGCLPAATKGGFQPTYIPTVVVTFESSLEPGLAALATGSADLVDTDPGGGGAGYGGDGGMVLSEARAGELDYIVGPAVDVDVATIALEYNVTAAAGWTGAPVSLPADATQDLNFRQFLVQSFPYSTAESQDCLIDGILYCFNIGGAIPADMGSYYPTNISWPLSDANTDPSDVGSAAWWWAQTASDSMVGASCTSASPCTFPIPSTGTPTESVLADWATTLRTISGGAIQAVVVPMTFAQDVDATLLQPSGNASVPIDGGFEWAPDYFDPSDYVVPVYFPEGLLSGFAGYGQYFASYNQPCAGPATDPTVTTACQGTAYAEMVSLLQAADACSAPSCSGNQRQLLYNMAERIAYDLGLDVSYGQEGALYAYAPWIAGSSILQNPDRNNVWGGATTDEPFFLIQYAADIPQGYQIHVEMSTGSGISSTPLATSVSTHGLHGSGAPGLSLEAGEPFLTLVSVSGGSGVYNYVWNGLPTGCASSDSAVLACRPTAGGNFTMSVSVVDSRGDTGTSNAITLEVAAHVAISDFVASPPTLVLGHAVTFTVTTAGGIGTLAYGYVGLPAGCMAVNQSSFSCTPSAPGHYSVTATVTDSIGFQAVSTLELIVNSPKAPTGFLGLPGDDGYFVIAGLVIALGAAAVGWGYRRRTAAAPAPAQGAATTAPSTAPATKGPTSVACPRCGASNRSGAKFCDQCAGPLPPG